jgi:hypothetical protein
MPQNQTEEKVNHNIFLHFWLPLLPSNWSLDQLVIGQKLYVHNGQICLLLNYVLDYFKKYSFLYQS